MEIILVRHCEATGQESDAELTTNGREQAKVLAGFLSDHTIRRVISSPYSRAVRSAEPLAERLQLAIETDQRLIERNLGKIKGTDWVSPLRTSFDDLDICLPDGESTRNAMMRGRVVIDEARDRGLPAAIFTHGNLLSLIVKSFNNEVGFDFWQGLTNPDVFLLSKVDECVKIERLWR